MRIAICDDDNDVINTIENLMTDLSASYEDMQWDTYNSGEELLKEYQGVLDSVKPFDILFLDIEMKALNGVEVAKEIRKFDVNAVIVYISSHTKYARECFVVSPFRFLEKPVNSDEFLVVFKLAYAKAKVENKPFCLNFKGENTRLFCNDILYFESLKRKMIVYTVNGNYEFYSTIDQTLQLLDSDTFINPHRSYIVNMNYIAGFSSHEMTLTNNKIIPISRYKKGVREQYLKYLERKVGYD